MEDRLHSYKNRKVLVTGGTGFTGTYLVRRLVEIGAEVSVIVRSPSRKMEFENLPINWIEGQVFDPEVIARAVSGQEYIFHLAAAYREAKWADDYYRKVHFDSTRLLVECAMGEGEKTLKRFVHVSTVGVLGHIEHPPADENSPYNPGDIYQITKADAEKWVMDYQCAHPAFDYAVIRPAAIFGPGDTRLLKFFKMARWPFFPILGFGKTLYHLIHVDDLVNAILLCGVDPKASRQVFICGNRESSSLVEMATDISHTVNHAVRILRLPVWPFFLMARLNETVAKWLHCEPLLHTRRVAFYTKDRSFITQKLQKELNFQYKYDNHSGIVSTARWYMEHKWL